MRMHVQTVIWQERTDIVGDGSGNLVDGLQLLKSILGRGQAERGRLRHQAEFGIDVVLFLLLGEIMPCFSLQLLLAFLGRRRWRRRWGRGMRRGCCSWQPGIQRNRVGKCHRTGRHDDQRDDCRAEEHRDKED